MKDNFHVRTSHGSCFAPPTALPRASKLTAGQRTNEIGHPQKLLPNVAREPDLVRGITKHAILQKEKWTIV